MTNDWVKTWPSASVLRQTLNTTHLRHCTTRRVARTEEQIAGGFSWSVTKTYNNIATRVKIWIALACCMVSNSECSFKRSKMDDTCCTSPLLLVFGSLFAVKSNTRRPLNTNPIITPSNASSIRCLVLFHRPPTWIVDCLLNTLSWCPAKHKTPPTISSRPGQADDGLGSV